MVRKRLKYARERPQNNDIGNVNVGINKTKKQGFVNNPCCNFKKKRGK